MSQIIEKSVRSTASPRNATATAKSAAQFEAARRNRQPSYTGNHGVVVSIKDSAPGMMLIGAAIAEAIFIEPIRSIRRKFSKVA